MLTPSMGFTLWFTLLLTVAAGCASSGGSERQPAAAAAAAPQADAPRDTKPLLGMYTYMADAGRFTECGSGSAFPVAQVADNAALERAYGTARTGPGTPLLVGFPQGRERLSGAKYGNVNSSI